MIMKKILLVLFALSIFRTECSAQTVSGQVSGYDYVDLGLPSGTKWATYNVGATKPEEYGDYFAWGETKPKKEYNLNTYKWCNGSENNMTKYCTDSIYGTIDNIVRLDIKDDAATASWGDEWRMPTLDEIKELIDGCEWKIVTDFNGSGLNGRLGISKKNGATIFIPASGFRFSSHLIFFNNRGIYWTSSLSEKYSYQANALFFYDNHIDCNTHSRRFGQNIRAVVK